MNRKDDISRRVDGRRLAEDLWQLVQIPSPTRQERRCALAFAEMLAAAGAEVEVDETIAESPTVIGRLKGGRPGKTFQLAGHIDHIDVPHPPPARDGETITGRGVSDMKAGLAGILEVVRVLHETRRPFSGEVLVTAYGLHEAPLGDSRGLLNLLKRGVAGDAALVAESTCAARDKAVVAGKGQAIWNLTVKWRGRTCHELSRPREADGLLDTALGLVAALRTESQRLDGERRNRLLGPESLFIGQLHCGDFYNRVPTVCTVQGTRRWNPGRTFPAVRDEFLRLIRRVPLGKGVTVRAEWSLTGEAYRVEAADAVVRSLRAAYRAVRGRPMALGAISAVTDANRLVALGGVPAVLCGFENRSAHADRETVRPRNLIGPCRIALLTVLNFLRGSKGSPR